MSQFFGAIALRSNVNIPKIAQQMQDNMAFFTPDALGTYQTEHVFICNKLLHNTPESVHTPLMCQTDRYVLAATCRIDNRADLRVKLNLQGAVFGDNALSDHAYILKAYEIYQEDCVKHLIGDFSFVVWDKQEEKLFMAKDHLGVKPLFYTLQNESLFFSTDMNAFKNCISLEWSEFYLANLLAGQSVDVEHTCYEYVFRVKPAHYTIFQEAKLIENKYWELKPQKSIIYNTEDVYYERFLELFEEAVKCRMRSVYPIGAELSGGLDSSGITCMAARILKNNISQLKTFSFVQSDEARDYDDSCREEEDEQEIVLSHINLPRENVYKVKHWGFNSVFDMLDDEFKTNGGIEITSLHWQKPIYEQMQTANCRTKLSGFLGDEMVTEYGTFWYFDILSKLSIQNYIAFIKQVGVKSGIKKIGRYWLTQLHDSRYSSFKTTRKNKNYLNPKANQFLKEPKGMGSPRSYSSIRIGRTTQRPFTTLRMENENINGLRHNIEVNFPMADIRLLTFMLSVPPHILASNHISRAFFRKATSKLIPDAVRMRNDKTINVLIFGYYRNFILLKELKNAWENETITDNDFILQYLINFEKIRKSLNYKREELTQQPSLLSNFFNVLQLRRAFRSGFLRSKSFIYI